MQDLLYKSICGFTVRIFYLLFKQLWSLIIGFIFNFNTELKTLCCWLLSSFGTRTVDCMESRDSAVVRVFVGSRPDPQGRKHNTRRDVAMSVEVKAAGLTFHPSLSSIVKSALSLKERLKLKMIKTFLVCTEHVQLSTEIRAAAVT